MSEIPNSTYCMLSPVNTLNDDDGGSTVCLGHKYVRVWYDVDDNNTEDDGKTQAQHKIREPMPSVSYATITITKVNGPRSFGPEERIWEK